MRSVQAGWRSLGPRIVRDPQAPAGPVVSKAPSAASRKATDRLFKAVSNRRAESIPELLASGADPIFVQGELTALMLAANLGDADSVRALLPVSDPNQRSVSTGSTALMLAAYAGNLECVKLLAPVSDLGCKNKNGTTALAFALEPSDDAAVFFGRVQCHRCMSGMPPVSIETQTLLHQAAVGVSADFSSLVARGGDLRDLGNHDRTALMWAACNGHDECVRALLALGADPRQQAANGSTALMWAASQGRLDCVKALAPLSDLRAVNSLGYTALFYAIDADTSAAHQLTLGNLECARFLMPLSDLEHRDNEGRTALILAAQTGNVDAIERLIPLVDVRRVDNKEKSALDWALEQERWDSVDLLCEGLSREETAIALRRALSTLSPNLGNRFSRVFVAAEQTATALDGR